MLMHENVTWMEIIDHPGKCLNAFEGNFQIPVLNEQEKKVMLKSIQGILLLAGHSQAP